MFREKRENVVSLYLIESLVASPQTCKNIKVTLYLNREITETKSDFLPKSNFASRV